MTHSARVERLSRFARQFVRRTHGQDLVEYALMAGMVTSLTVAVLSDIGQRVTDYYTATVTEVAARTSAAGTMPVGGGNGGNNGNGGGGGSTGGDTGGGTGGDTGGGGTTGGGNGNGNGGGKK